MAGLLNNRTAVFSADKTYRYALSYYWNANAPQLCWVMCNPSSADGEKDDPTTRKVTYFTKAWGFGGWVIVNVYAYRAVSPALMWAAYFTHGVDIVGPDNYNHLCAAIAATDSLICGWGDSVDPKESVSTRRILAALRGDTGLTCLGVTKTGNPRHPLWVPKATPRVAYS